MATCGSEEKAALLRRLGADRVINYRKEDLKAVLRAEYPKVHAYSNHDDSICPSCTCRQCLAAPWPFNWEAFLIVSCGSWLAAARRLHHPHRCVTGGFALEWPVL